MLPLEILTEIASVDEEAYRSMLSIPEFARSTLNKKINESFQRKFTKRKIISSGFLCSRVKIPFCIVYLLCEKRHRIEKDANGYVLPAVIDVDGSEFWYKNGKRHRDDRDENGRVLPAIVYSKIAKCYSNNRVWCINGKLHREDKDENGYVLPAWIWDNGYSKCWYKNGKLHRDDKDENGRILPAEIDIRLGKNWFINGENLEYTATRYQFS